MKRILLALWFVSLAVASAVATQYTNPTTLPQADGNGVFQDLGLGPLEFQVLSGGPITVIVSDAQPANNATGNILGVRGEPLRYESASHLWARSLGGQAALQVTTGVLGGAANPVASAPVAVTPLGYCQLTPAAATLLSACSGGIPAGATIVNLVSENAAIRYRDDGTNPTSSVGTPLQPGQPLNGYKGALSALSIIQQSPSATVNVVFYK